MAKHYIIILVPEEIAGKLIVDFRVRCTGSELVDSLPPHVTLKSRFYLRDGVTEEDLIKIFEGININALDIIFNNTRMLNDAFVLSGESDYAHEKHNEVRKILADSVVDVRPKFEGDNYKIHLTLWRSRATEFTAEAYLGKMRFDRICLYEIDSTIDRAFARMIICKKMIPAAQGGSF